MRSFAYSLLYADTALLAVVPVGQIKASGGADVAPNVTLPTPFIVVRGLSDVRVFRTDVRQCAVSIHIHDAPGSYVQIDSIVAMVNRIMDAAAPRAWGAKWVMDVEDQGWSEDLYDDHYRTASRYGTYKITARQ